MNDSSTKRSEQLLRIRKKISRGSICVCEWFVRVKIDTVGVMIDSLAVVLYLELSKIWRQQR